MDKIIRNNDIYPEWHFRPLRLLKAEMTNPMGVIKEFSAVRTSHTQHRLHLRWTSGIVFNYNF